MKNIVIFYVAKKTETEGFLKAVILPEMPDSLADELINGFVRPQMRIFLDNLALLQGYEGAEFQLAYEDIQEGADKYGKTGLQDKS